MIKSYIPKHLDYLNKNINSNTIIVYKWFSNKFIENISSKYSYIFDDNNKFKDWKINLEYLKNSYKKLLLSLENFSDKKILLYEELVFLNSKNINIYEL